MAMVGARQKRHRGEDKAQQDHVAAFSPLSKSGMANGSASAPPSGSSGLSIRDQSLLLLIV
jgi:hypothetical protein